MAKSGAFISYARKDGEAFANALHDRLQSEAPDVRIWQDRPEIEGGVGWWRQIEDALENVEFLIIVMTDAVLESEITRKEWRYARQQGVCVYPVKGPGFDFADPRLTRWMQRAHIYDLDIQWRTFVEHLRRGCKAPRVPFMAPDRPPAFVPRPSEFGKLRSLLLDSAKRDPVAVTTALTGAGGFGKTTLASALCHDDDVILAYDDGILWVTLGEQPNVVDALAKLYAGLTGQRPQFRDAEDAAVTLAQKLEHKTCLIVIDDVWDYDHLKYFLRGAQHCGRLITTRQVDVASEVSAASVSVDEMSCDEAVAMLAARLKTLPDDLSPLQELARRLGKWPVLLRIAAAAIAQRIERGDTAENALANLSRLLERGGVTVLDRRSADDRHAGVASTLAGSLRLFDEGEQQQYRELAIFPEDEAIPLAVVGELWRTDELGAERLVAKYANASLVEFDLRKGTMRLHDVLREYLATSLGPDGLSEVHARLVERWGDLSALPHAYAWRWIGYHLSNARRHEDLDTLLLDLDWVRRKFEATDIESLLREFDHGPQGVRVGLMREALRLSSHVFGKNTAELAGQLLGRIPETALSLRQAIQDKESAQARPWIRPLRPSLTNAGGPLLCMLGRHADQVSSVAVTPDGKRVTSCSADGALKVWDLEAGSELRTLNSQGITSIAVTPDGKHLVAGHIDGPLEVWDLESRSRPRTLEGNMRGVTSVAVTSDGKRVVLGCHDRTLKVWNLESGRAVRTLDGHTGWVSAVAVSADGKLAVSSSADGTLKVWNLDVWRELRTLLGHTTVVRSVALTQDGKRAVSGSDDGTLKLWDLQSGRELRSFEGHSAWVGAAAVTPDDKRIVSGSGDGTLRVWDLESGRELRKHSWPTGCIAAIALTPDGRCVVSGSDDGTLRVWNLESERDMSTPLGHTARILAVAVTADHKRAVSGSEDGTLKVWDCESGRELVALSVHADLVNFVAVAPNGNRLASHCIDGTLKVWDVESARELLTRANFTEWVGAVALTPDGRCAVSSSRESTLKVWEIESGRTRRIFAGHKDSVRSVVVTADGKLAVSGSSDKTLKVWNLETGHEMRTLSGHTERVLAVAVSADGKRAVSGSADMTLRVWDLETGHEVRTLSGHTDLVRSVAVTPDGQRAASGADDGTLKVWDLATGDLVACFTGEAGVCACAFASDRKSLVVGDVGGRVHFLRLESIPCHLSDGSVVVLPGHSAESDASDGAA